jgi:hypothetical protein
MYKSKVPVVHADAIPTEGISNAAVRQSLHRPPEAPCIGLSGLTLDFGSQICYISGLKSAIPDRHVTRHVVTRVTSQPKRYSVRRVVS